MAYSWPNAWYSSFGNGSTTGYYAVAKRAQNAAVAAGALARQFTAPSLGNERVFACVVAGTTANTTDATWTITKGAKTTDGTVTWIEVTGQPGVNGDFSSNCPVWVTSSTPSLGMVIYDSGTASLQVCTTSGAGGTGSAPSFSATAGVTTADGSAVWTSLGLASGFPTWAAPHARASNAVSWGAAGNTFYVADNSAESFGASYTIAPPGTVASPCYVLSIDHTASMPPSSASLKAGASISTTGYNDFNIGNAASGVCYWYGITFGFGANHGDTFEIGSGALYNYFNKCTFNPNGGNINGLSLSGGRITWDNCVLSYGGITQAAVAVASTDFIWKNTPSGAYSASNPNGTLFNFSNYCKMVCEGLDLSGFVNGGSTFYLIAAGTNAYALFKDCKLASTTKAINGMTTNVGPTVEIVNCSSSGVNYVNERHTGEGDLTTSTTVYRSGGASDGTTPVSHQIVPNSYVQWWRPFTGLPLAIWNSVTGTNRNVTLYGVVNAAALPNNDQFWFDAEYLGSASSPLGSFGSGTKSSVLATGSALTADSSTWVSPVRQNSHAYSVGDIMHPTGNSSRVFFCTTAGTSAGSEPGGYSSAVDGGSVTDGGAVFRAGCRFSLTVTLSSPQPAQVGYLYAFPKAATAATFFVDPLVVLS